ncbi:MAG TPA: YgaP-like transmembrane domain, partial [Longilinea sp.]|nr:YgaP-like transmembrane domain [Longilinea sp.]
GPFLFQRLLRVLGSLVIAVIAWYSGQSILLYIVAAVLLFTAVYDRCPIFKAIAAKLGWRI